MQYSLYYLPMFWSKAILKSMVAPKGVGIWQVRSWKVCDWWWMLSMSLFILLIECLCCTDLMLTHLVRYSLSRCSHQQAHDNLRCVSAAPITTNAKRICSTIVNISRNDMPSHCNQGYHERQCRRYYGHRDVHLLMSGFENDKIWVHANIGRMDTLQIFPPNITMIQLTPPTTIRDNHQQLTLSCW